MNNIDRDEILKNLNNNAIYPDIVESKIVLAGTTDIKYFKFNEADTFYIIFADPLNKSYMPASIILPSYYKSKPVAGIGTSGFSNILSLTTVYMESEIKAIGNNAFSNCTNLDKVTINADLVPKLGSNVFSNTSENLSIYVPEKMVDLFKADNSWIDYKNRIKAIDNSDIPDNPEIPTIATNNGSVNVIVPTIVDSNNIVIINKFYFNSVADDDDESRRTTIVEYDTDYKK